jgi:hypothetical protein
MRQANQAFCETSIGKVGLVVYFGAKVVWKGHAVELDLVYKEVRRSSCQQGLLNRWRGAFGPWRCSDSHATLVLMALVTNALPDAEWVTPCCKGMRSNES